MSGYIDGATWVNDGKVEKIVSGKDLKSTLKDGWKKGMLASMKKPTKKAE